MSNEVPKVVKFSRSGVTVDALVLSARFGEVSHEGANGEPLLTLAIVKQPAPNAPHKRPTVLQASVAEPELEIVRDAVHASHEFSHEFKREKGLTTPALIATHRGDGEWSETSRSGFAEGYQAALEVCMALSDKNAQPSVPAPLPTVEPADAPTEELPAATDDDEVIQ